MKTLTTAAAALALAAPALAQEDVTLQISESPEYGPYLATARGRDEDGRPVYMFATDIPAAGGREAQVTCTSDECRRDWTPVTGEVSVGDGVDPDLVGTMVFNAQQLVLYNGWPLYHYEMDQIPTTEAPRGHGDVSFGAPWYLLSPAGEPIRD